MGDQGVNQSQITGCTGPVTTVEKEDLYRQKEHPRRRGGIHYWIAESKMAPQGGRVGLQGPRWQNSKLILDATIYVGRTPEPGTLLMSS